MMEIARIFCAAPSIACRRAGDSNEDARSPLRRLQAKSDKEEPVNRTHTHTVAPVATREATTSIMERTVAATCDACDAMVSCGAADHSCRS